MEYLSEVLHTKSFFILLQEPYAWKGKIAGFDKIHSLFYDHASPSPRTAIYASKDLHLWSMPEFTSQDMTTCLWLTGESHLPKIILTSVYMDHTNPQVWPEAFGRLLHYCHQGRHKLIISADTNAHSTLWGSDDTNVRGKAIEDLVFLNNLAIHNTGNHHTFFNRRSATIIDVTFSTEDLTDVISNWMVDPSYAGSDHHLIRFDVTISSPKPIATRNLRVGDWLLFQKTLKNSINNYDPPVWNL